MNMKPVAELGGGTTADELINAFLSLETPLGPHKLFLRSFSGTEAMSQLFSFQLDMVSQDPEIKFDDIIGQNVTVGVKLSDATTERLFNGFISSFSQLPNEGRVAHYQAEMVPWLWFLTRTADCVIFQEQTVPEIIQEVFKKKGFAAFVDFQLQREYKKWEYCVQYRESACNFVMRLMEQEGIFFFFKHENGTHKLVLADSPAASKPCPNHPKVRYTPRTRSGSTADEDTVFSWRVHQEMRPGKYALNDFNFKTPSNSLLVQVASKIKQGGNDRFEVYDFPGEYDTREEGDEYVAARMEEEEVPHVNATGEGNCRSFVPGFRFDLTESDREDQNATYVLTSVTHTAFETGSFSDTGETSYNNFFTCIPVSVPFRPPRVTPRPLVQGTQTAIVVGPKGEEIFTDKFGRVKVRFHWDRDTKRPPEEKSCWIRVSHPWAGKGWGSVSIPRIGQEVIVDFLEGDPDQPIITGRVYNAEQMPPYGLPAGGVVSGLKSNSTKGGGGYNEMSMNDTKGRELITVHAQYDMDSTVEHDDRQTVHNNRTINVDGTHTETIVKDTTINVTDGKESNTVKNEILVTSQTKHIYLTAETEIKLEVGASKLHMFKNGDINLTGVNIAIDGSQKIRIHSMEITSDADMQHHTSGKIVVSEGAVSNTVRGAMVMLNP
jgi:type VI secretion system secreted protein VgrG